MVEKHIGRDESKGILYDELEDFARGKIREHLQDLLEQEVTEWLGREKSERKVSPLEQPGYRNGYGKRRRFTMSLGTIEVYRPRERKDLVPSVDTWVAKTARYLKSVEESYASRFLVSSTSALAYTGVPMFNNIIVCLDAKMRTLSNYFLGEIRD